MKIGREKQYKHIDYKAIKMPKKQVVISDAKRDTSYMIDNSNVQCQNTGIQYGIGRTDHISLNASEQHNIDKAVQLTQKG